MENLENVVDFIVENNLIGKGDKVGVGVSGGVDSMALLYFLNSISKKCGFSIVAVNINHNIRPESKRDSAFVAKYCKDNKIELLKYNVDVPAHVKQFKMGIEQSARIKRYECFELAIKKAKLTKFAIAHHQSDQAETILLHIFRGSGLAGARGMDAKRGIYIRPFLETIKADIISYVYRNQIPYIEDESNQDDSYSRNFIRNQVIPTLQREWRGVEKNIVDFGNNCRCDDDYLNSVINTNSFQVADNVVRIPLNLFAYPEAFVNRLLITAFDKIGARENIEKKHIELASELAKNGENGKRVDLPNGLFATREYEYLAIVKKQPSSVTKTYPFKIGKTVFAEYGTIQVTKTIGYKDAMKRGLIVMDADLLPKAAKWRTRKDGDTFTKFGGGTKALNSYFIDKKTPSRLRDKVPVLAHGSEIYLIAGHDISDKVKIDHDTIEAFVVEFITD
ncbi:MAG: tRNA lysidine(34) synthetase TilS [Firmicutes bacterium]|nr:tRNA lysidine(34) synthetase TilS [Bacillota bacterium]